MKYIFCGVSVKNFVWNVKVAFEISHEILNPYTAKCAFYDMLKFWRIMASLSFDVLSLTFKP